IHTHPQSHAGYYPGAQGMSLKLLVDPDTDAILGAQGVGGDGVDKRIDVIATAMVGGLTASELADLELAYAPQFGSAKDPVNMLGYVADNLRTGTTGTVQWHELAALVEAGAAVVDVRTPAEFALGSIPGAVNVELDQLRLRAAELPDGELIAVCQVGQRGHTATQLLRQLGRSVRNLDGGYRTWLAGQVPVDQFV
ncbi:rhodanese-like domain-containing protein, partial [Rhodococcus sp. NPDC058514]